MFAVYLHFRLQSLTLGLIAFSKVSLVNFLQSPRSSIEPKIPRILVVVRVRCTVGKIDFVSVGGNTILGSVFRLSFPYGASVRSFILVWGIPSVKNKAYNIDHSPTTTTSDTTMMMGNVKVVFIKFDG